MDDNLDYEMVFSALRRLATFMAPTATDPTAAQIAKGAFSVSIAVATAAVVVVAVPSCLTCRATE